MNRFDNKAAEISTPSGLITRLVLIPAVCCLLSLPASAQEPLIADSHCGKYLEVLPLASESNPYQDEYMEWDEWLIGHAVNPGNGMLKLANAGRLPEEMEEARMWVSTDGYVVPMLEYYKAKYDPETAADLADCPFYLTCIGEFPPDMRDGLAAEMAQIRAPFLPAVPGWLADQPARTVLFLEGGEIVLQGKPGSGIGLEAVLWPEADGGSVSKDACYLCNSEGTIVARTAEGEEWWRLYFSNFDEVVAGFGSPTLTWMEHNGYIVFTDSLKISTFEVYDFHGGKVGNLNEVFSSRDVFHWVDGGSLPLIHAAQQ